MGRTEVAGALESFFENHAGDDVVVAYLFGSEAEGRAHKDSDVDVAVMLNRRSFPSARERFDYRITLVGHLIAFLHRNEIDVVVLNDAPPLFARRIVTEGVRVFSRDRLAAQELIRDICLRAADVAPFVSRGRRRLLARWVS